MTIFTYTTARLSGTRFESIEELGRESSNEDGLFSSFFKRMKHWLLSQSQHLNFFTILILASVSINVHFLFTFIIVISIWFTYSFYLMFLCKKVPNPLFDLAGIMCGQFGVPFWKFFIAILTGKALIKAHIQVFIIVMVLSFDL